MPSGFSHVKTAPSCLGRTIDFVLHDARLFDFLSRLSRCSLNRWLLQDGRRTTRLFFFWGGVPFNSSPLLSPLSSDSVSDSSGDIAAIISPLFKSSLAASVRLLVSSKAFFRRRSFYAYEYQEFWFVLCLEGYNMHTNLCEPCSSSLSL